MGSVESTTIGSLETDGKGAAGREGGTEGVNVETSGFGIGGVCPWGGRATGAGDGVTGLGACAATR